MCSDDPLLEPKCDKLSEKYREDGNNEYKKNAKSSHFGAQGCKLMHSLWLLNKALCYAKSKEKLAIIYADRSLVFLTLEKFDECLQNIKWARENGYPKSMMNELDEREEKCKPGNRKFTKSFNSDKSLADENPLDYFKLSHPPNPKIPFIVDCLEYRNGNGGGIYATRDLKAGDFIAIEPMIYGHLHSSAQYTRCCRCFKTAMGNLIPCLKNASLMYCSEECRDKTYETVKDLRTLIRFYGVGLTFNFEAALAFGDEACGSRTKLKLFVKENNINKWKKNIFDFDFSKGPDDPEYKLNMLKCILSLKPSGRADLQFNINHEPTHYADDPMTLKFLQRFMAVFLRNETLNANVLLDHGQLIEGLFLYPMLHLFKHACNNNIGRFQVDTKMYYYAAVPIKKGQELTVNYCGNFHGAYSMNTAERKAHLKRVELDCNCFFCANNIDSSKLHTTDPHEFWFELMASRQFSDIRICGSYKTVFEELKKCWNLMSETAYDPLSYRVEKLRARTEKLLMVAGCLLAYPCVPDDMYG